MVFWELSCPANGERDEYNSEYSIEPISEYYNEYDTGRSNSRTSNPSAGHGLPGDVRQSETVGFTEIVGITGIVGFTEIVGITGIACFKETAGFSRGESTTEGSDQRESPVHSSPAWIIIKGWFRESHQPDLW